MAGNPSSNFYGGGYYWLDAPIMQASMMATKGWKTYPVGIGLGTDYNFMDRFARAGATADQNGMSLRGSGNPAEYEERSSRTSLPTQTFDSSTSSTAWRRSPTVAIALLLTLASAGDNRNAGPSARLERGRATSEAAAYLLQEYARLLRAIQRPSEADQALDRSRAIRRELYGA